MKIQYQLGTKSFTSEMDIDNIHVINKQLGISKPMITSAIITGNNGYLKRIYIGRKIDLYPNTISQTYYTEKYDLSLDELIDLYLEGYTSVCLLNYKKYDQVVVGLHEDDEVVPDYYSLRDRIKNLAIESSLK